MTTNTGRKQSFLKDKSLFLMLLTAFQEQILILLWPMIGKNLTNKICNKSVNIILLFIYCLTMSIGIQFSLILSRHWVTKHYEI